MRKSSQVGRLSHQIRAEATEWLIRFSEEEVDAAARRDFQYWLRVSPEHVRAYLRIVAFWHDADRIGGQKRDIDALVELAATEHNIFPFQPQAALPPVSQEPPAHSRARFRTRRVAEISVAALLLIALIGSLATWLIQYRGSVYVTGIGEQRTIRLPDGSSAIMNAQSRIAINYGKTSRDITVLEGQALFQVARNSARPFVVRSGATQIRALGTQFDVYKRERGTIVTVMEGRVAVSPEAPASNGGHRSQVSAEAPVTPTVLSAGEQAVVTASGAHRSKVNRPEAVTAWTAGLLVFDSAPLSDVATEFNRQNSRQLTILGDDLQRLRISGTFPATGPERMVHFLKDRFNVRVEESEDEIKISLP